MTDPTIRKNQHSTLLKVVALVIGYSFWHIFGGSHTAAVTVSVPLCFYNIPTETQLNAPESISVKLTGKRTDLRALDHTHLALHINATNLKKGKNLLHLSKEELLLPQTIQLVQYAPSNPTVELLPQDTV